MKYTTYRLLVTHNDIDKAIQEMSYEANINRDHYDFHFTDAFNGVWCLTAIMKPRYEKMKSFL